MARHDYGRVTLDLDGEAYQLDVTIDALTAINRRYGDLRSALERLTRLDFEALAFVVSQGAGLNKSQEKSMRDRLFSHGFAEAIGPCSDYMAKLMNPSGEDEEAGETEGKG